MYLICDYRGTIAEICRQAVWIKHQKNGVDISCEEKDANAIYSNDTDSFYPAGRPCTAANRYHIVTVDVVPDNVVALEYKYINGEFIPMGENDRVDPEVRLLKTDKGVKKVASDTTDLQLALVDEYEQNIDLNNQITDLQLTIVDLYESTVKA